MKNEYERNIKVNMNVKICTFGRKKFIFFIFYFAEQFILFRRFFHALI